MATKYESFESVENANSTLKFFGDDLYRGQTFSPQIEHPLGKISFYMAKTDGSPTGDIIFDVYLCSGHEPIGLVLATGTLDASTVLTEPDWYDVPLTGSPTLAVDSEYLIIAHHPDGENTNAVGIKAITTGGYTRGQAQGSNDGGETWLTDHPYFPNYDCYVKELGPEDFIPKIMIF